MIWIACLKMRGFKCYREEQALDLEPRAYAIFARVAEDEQRSNWAGKSSLCEAVDFALYGRLAAEFKARKKGWISRGEKSGEVELTLSDGSRIQRSQTLAGSERLWYYPPGDPTKGATQDAAQQRIDELVGLSREDFAATRYFRQGKMDELITLDPGKRLDLVAGWLRLEPLQGCEDDAAEVLREVARRRDDASGKARAADDEIARLYERVGLADAYALGSGPQDLAAAVEHARVAEKAAATLVEAARGALEGDREREAARTAAEAYERTVEQGKALAEEFGDLSGVLGGRMSPQEFREIHGEFVAELAEAETALQRATEARGGADAEAATKRRLLAGGFDGRCPLVGAPCPSRAFVEDVGGKSRAAFDAASERLREAAAVLESTRRTRDHAASTLRRLDDGWRRLGELRAEAARLKPAHERWQALSEASAGAAVARAALASAEAEHVGARAQVAALQMVAQQIADAESRRDESRAEAERLERAVRAAAAAVAVFGKGGAQRRMAEDALTEIQDRACEMMATAGVPLSVEIRWSREGSGVAATCAACGDAFPKSEKVKTCGRCGEQRGANVVHKLEIEPSAQSGGARDLAGIFVQLAAAAWLVEDRGARWATAMLDEPLAALDQAMRKAVSAHLPAILRECCVAQCLVIGHDRAALESLAGRIEVVSEGGWSRATVRS